MKSFLLHVFNTSFPLQEKAVKLKLSSKCKVVLLYMSINDCITSDKGIHPSA